jgi:hypothetical protein
MATTKQRSIVKGTKDGALYINVQELFKQEDVQELVKKLEASELIKKIREARKYVVAK